jgi:hypothetical protein
MTCLLTVGLRPAASDSGLASLVRRTKWTRDGQIEPLVSAWSEAFPILGRDIYYNANDNLTDDRAAVIPCDVPLRIYLSQGNIGGTIGSRDLEKKAIVMALHIPFEGNGTETWKVLSAQDKRTERVRQRNLKEQGFNDRQIERQLWSGLLEGQVDVEYLKPGRKIHIKITRDQPRAQAIDMWFVVSNCGARSWKGVPQGGTPSPQAMVPATPAPNFASPQFAPQGNLPPQPFPVPGAAGSVPPQVGAPTQDVAMGAGNGRLCIRFQDRNGAPCQGPWEVQVFGFNSNGQNVFGPIPARVNGGMLDVDVPCGLWYTVISKQTFWLSAQAKSSQSRVSNGRFEVFVSQNGGLMVWRKG